MADTVLAAVVLKPALVSWGPNRKQRFQTLRRRPPNWIDSGGQGLRFVGGSHAILRCGYVENGADYSERNATSDGGKELIGPVVFVARNGRFFSKCASLREILGSFVFRR